MLAAGHHSRMNSATRARHAELGAACHAVGHSVGCVVQVVEQSHQHKGHDRQHDPLELHGWRRAAASGGRADCCDRENIDFRRPVLQKPDEDNVDVCAGDMKI
eukprot:scaffold14145_cov79-Isochrysis_galbana.AAC.1